MSNVYYQILIEKMNKRSLHKIWDGVSQPEKKVPTLTEQIEAVKMIPRRDRSHEDWRFIADNNQFKVKQ